MEEKRRFFKKTDVILVAGALLIALGRCLLNRCKRSPFGCVITICSILKFRLC